MPLETSSQREACSMMEVSDKGEDVHEKFSVEPCVENEMWLKEGILEKKCAEEAKLNKSSTEACLEQDVCVIENDKEGMICVKIEPEECVEMGEGSVDAASVLYTDHKVEIDIVLGPEVWHQPQLVISGVPGQQLSTSSSASLQHPTGTEDYARIINTQYPHKCEFCGKIYKTKSSLNKHIRITHLSTEDTEKTSRNAPETYKCGFCLNIFKYKRSLWAHITAKHDPSKTLPKPNPNPVKINSASLQHPTGTEDYTSITNTQYPHKCEFCGKIYKTKSSLNKHIRITHLSTEDTEKTSRNAPETYKCGFCLKIFKCKRSLWAHTTAKHDPSKTLPKPKPRSKKVKIKTENPVKINFKCPQCSYTTTHSNNLLKHLKKHTIMHTCSYCEYKTPDRGRMNQHVKLQHLNAPVQCDYCGYKCRIKPALVRHIRMNHTNERLFECTDCDAKFFDKYSLLRHLKSHTDYRPYACEYCDYKCVLITELKRHRVRHSEEQPICDHCKKKFVNKFTLRKHLVTHTDLKPFQCDYCEYKARNKSTLLRHQRKIHGYTDPNMCIQMCENQRSPVPFQKPPSPLYVECGGSLTSTPSSSNVCVSVDIRSRSPSPASKRVCRPNEIGSESLSTLKFVQRSLCVEQQPTVNTMEDSLNEGDSAPSPPARRILMARGRQRSKGRTPSGSARPQRQLRDIEIANLLHYGSEEESDSDEDDELLRPFLIPKTLRTVLETPEDQDEEEIPNATPSIVSSSTTFGSSNNTPATQDSATVPDSTLAAIPAASCATNTLVSSSTTVGSSNNTPAAQDCATVSDSTLAAIPAAFCAPNTPSIVSSSTTVGSSNNTPAAQDSACPDATLAAIPAASCATNTPSIVSSSTTVGSSNNTPAAQDSATVPDATLAAIPAASCATNTTSSVVDNASTISEAISEPVYFPNDFLDFQWRDFPDPPIPPTERREPFIDANCGPTVTLSDPYELFTAIWDREFMETIVIETNRYAQQMASEMMFKGELYANSRILDWKETSADELYVYFAIILTMGIVIKSRIEDYWSTDMDIFCTPGFRVLMSLRRFQLLNRCLHFNNCEGMYGQNLDPSEAKLFKVQPVISHLNNKFSTMYKMQQNIALDESLLQWKGWLDINQLSPNKAAAVGIKSYEILESQSGYLWRFIIHAHNPAPQAAPQPDPFAASTPALVLNLIKGLEYTGYTLWMDNFYNSPALARKLKSLGFDCVGTLRTNRQHVPRELTNMTKANMGPGQIVGYTSGDVDVMVWRDQNRVATISTYHGNAVSTVNEVTKPILIRDYNNCLGGVDKKDQMLAAYPIERKRTRVWYKKIFRRLLNVSVLNSYIIHKKTAAAKLSHRNFRKQLILSLLQKHAQPKKPRQLPGSTIFEAKHHYAAAYPFLITSRKNRQRHPCKVCRKSSWTYCVGCNKAVCAFKCFSALHT